jgi:acetolactate synthase-1/2/3 large subunit
MNGAQSVVNTLLKSGVNTCFMNPGTSELHLVAAMTTTVGFRSVLALTEGVVTGAADGYARMSGRPAVALLHLAPGLANGLCNLHNARRARVPLLTIVGQHPVSHLQYDAPLTADLISLAKWSASWVRTARSGIGLAIDTDEAIQFASMPPGRLATLIVPADTAWMPGALPTSVPPPSKPPVPPISRIERAAKILRSGEPTALILGGHALQGEALWNAGRISAETGAPLLTIYPLTRIEQGGGRPSVQRLPYSPVDCAQQLKPFKNIFLVWSERPVAYFAAPDRDANLIPGDCKVEIFTEPDEDIIFALAQLASILKAPVYKQVEFTPRAESDKMQGPLSFEGIAAVISKSIIEGTIVVDEAITSGRGIMAAARSAPSHDWLGNTGGSIGIAMPLAVGCAVACPERPVLCLSADGSGMYTLQALWTAAREGLHIIVVIFANQRYAILQNEFRKTIGERLDETTLSMVQIDRPELDWVCLAKGMGVEASRAESLNELAYALDLGFAVKGPRLIEIYL